MKLTDDDIQDRSEEYGEGRISNAPDFDFENGAKWMRDEIIKSINMKDIFHICMGCANRFKSSDSKECSSCKDWIEDEK